MTSRELDEGVKIPTYFLPKIFLSVTSSEKKESSSLFAWGGNILQVLPYKFLICMLALLIVAVEPIIFDLIVLPLIVFSVMALIIISYIPAIDPNGPEIRCNSSCIIRSGGKKFFILLESYALIASSLQGNVANLSIVPIKSVGGSL